MFFGEEDSPFQNLPPEMIVEILSLVDQDRKKWARFVCRRWRWILDHPGSGLVSFKLIRGELTEYSMQCLLKSHLYIDNLSLVLTKVTCPMMTYSRNKFPPIRELTLERGNSDQLLTTILQYGCAQTESLKLDYWCFDHYRLDLLSSVLSGMRWFQLTELTLKVMLLIFRPSSGIEYPRVNGVKNSEENNVEGMELIFKKAKIPNLRALSLKIHTYVGEGELSTGITKLMSGFAIFLEHHSKTLKELQLELYVCHSSLEILLTFPNTSPSFFSAVQQKSVARDLKLERLDITTTHSEALFYLVPPCVWESDNLTKLKWYPTNSPSWLNLNPPSDTAKPIQSLVQQNRNTLTNVTTTFIDGEIDVDPFQLSWLESCPHLSELTITSCDKFLGVKLLLPTVRKLDISVFIDFKSIENTTTWISQAFRNVETVQFYVALTAVRRNLKLDWIQNLLNLPRLEEIRFRFTYGWYEQDGQTPLFFGPNLIRQYCSDKGRLMFSGKRQGGRDQDYFGDLHPLGPCFIRKLPNRNYN